MKTIKTKVTAKNIESANCEMESMKYPVFVNLSNHASDAWGKEQIEVAREYGRIQDIAFPQVAPDADETVVKQMVSEMVNRVTEAYTPEMCTLHVMGEMTYVYALVSELKARHFICVASTTERIVEMLPDGSKQSRFQFCRFRRY